MSRGPFCKSRDYDACRVPDGRDAGDRVVSGINVPRGYQDEGDYLVHMATEGRMTPEMFERIWQMQREEGWVYPRINRALLLKVEQKKKSKPEL